MSIKRHPAGKLFSAAVEHDGVVYVAGQVADDLAQGIKGQTEQVLKKIDAVHPPLGHHLRACVKTGYLCGYTPPPDQPVQWQL